MRIVRTIILLAAAAWLIPSPPEDQSDSRGVDDPRLTELVSAGVSMVADIGEFCSRQPAVCDSAHYLAVRLEGKAQYGMELLYHWAKDQRAQTLAVDGSGATGRNTLRLDDLIPEWRAPST